MNVNFKNDLASLINRYSIENNSNTPDFLLAGFLVRCLEAFETAKVEADNLLSPTFQTLDSTLQRQ